MRTIILSLFFLVSINIIADYPIMLNIKGDIEISDDFRDGVEEGLTVKGYSLVDEKAQEEALKENSKTRVSECYDDECLVDTGKMLAARALIVVNIDKKEDNKYKFKIKYIDFETGTTTKTKVFYYNNNLDNYEKLSTFGKNVVNKLFETEAHLDKKKVKRKEKKEIKEKRIKEIKITKKKEKVVSHDERYGYWDLNLSIVAGNQDYFFDFKDYNANYELDYEAEGNDIVFGLNFEINYRLNRNISFFLGTSIQSIAGTITDTYKIYEIKNDKYEEGTFTTNIEMITSKFLIGAQFSFGSHKKLGMLYFGRFSLGKGRFDITAESRIDETGKEFEHILDGASISFIEASLEAGVSIPINYNNFLDIYFNLSIDTPTSTSKLMDNLTYGDNGISVVGVLGVRYNVYTF